MTDTKHTPEPWRATVNNINEIWLHSDHVSFIAHVNGPNRKGELNPDAIRIIACVNACAGMTDPAAEIAALRARIEAYETGSDFIISQAQAAEWHTRLVDEEKENAALMAERDEWMAKAERRLHALKLVNSVNPKMGKRYESAWKIALAAIEEE